MVKVLKNDVLIIMPGSKSCNKLLPCYFCFWFILTKLICDKIDYQSASFSQLIMHCLSNNYQIITADSLSILFIQVQSYKYLSSTCDFFAW